MTPGAAARSLRRCAPERDVRFGTDPSTSALDLNCKMHELDNLCVVDSSFFVSSTAVNPTLTIIANSLRVADHIAERLGSPLTTFESPSPGAQRMSPQ
jgi:choline dehydrogenase-like flavoprotein